MRFVLRNEPIIIVDDLLYLGHRLFDALKRTVGFTFDFNLYLIPIGLREELSSKLV